MSKKEPPKAPVAPEGRFQTGVDSYFKLAPLTAEQQKQQQLAASAKHKQLVEQQRADRCKEARRGAGEEQAQAPGRPRKNEQRLHAIAGKPILKNTTSMHVMKG